MSATCITRCDRYPACLCALEREATPEASSLDASTNAPLASPHWRCRACDAVNQPMAMACSACGMVHGGVIVATIDGHCVRHVDRPAP